MPEEDSADPLCMLIFCVIIGYPFQISVFITPSSSLSVVLLYSLWLYKDEKTSFSEMCYVDLMNKIL